MSRILNEAGAYQPEQPATQEAPVVDPAKLPQQKPDPYANVNATDFSNAANMSQAELLKMADIATSQGLPGAASTWKSAAVQKAHADQIAADAARLKDMSAPKAMPPVGRILDQSGTAPWAADPDHKRLVVEAAEAKAAVDAANPGAPNLLDLRNRWSAAQDAVKDREQEIIGNLKASGVFTEQDERTLDAEQSLAAKAAGLAEQLR